MAAYIKTDDKSHIVMKEKDFVKWDPKYKVGIPVIDEARFREILEKQSFSD